MVLSDDAHGGKKNPGGRTGIPIVKPPKDVLDRLYEQGHCVGTEGNLFVSTDPMDMAFALAECDGCPVQRECDQLVQPRWSFFDGVCAGKAWIDGRPVEVRSVGQLLDPAVPPQRTSPQPWPLPEESPAMPTPGVST